MGNLGNVKINKDQVVLPVSDQDWVRNGHKGYFIIFPLYAGGQEKISGR